MHDNVRNISETVIVRGGGPYQQRTSVRDLCYVFAQIDLFRGRGTTLPPDIAPKPEKE